MGGWLAEFFFLMDFDAQARSVLSLFFCLEVREGDDL